MVMEAQYLTPVCECVYNGWHEKSENQKHESQNENILNTSDCY